MDQIKLTCVTATLLAVLLTGCATGGNQSSEFIKIGHVVALSGDLAKWGTVREERA